MLVLGINTVTPEQWIMLFCDGKIVAKKKWTGRYDETEKILPHIVSLLKKEKFYFQNLDGILVIRGPGNFSSVRIGVTIANTLAFALKIPVFALTAKEFSGKFWRKWKKQKIAIPYYNKLPHITFPKS